MSNVKKFTDGNFEQDVLKAGKPVLVDFWAAWCGPCHMIAPAIEELADDFAGQVEIGKLDVDENQATAAKYGVMSIPTLILFRDGKVMTKLTGARPKSDLTAQLNYFLQAVPSN